MSRSTQAERLRAVARSKTAEYAPFEQTDDTPAGAMTSSGQSDHLRNSSIELNGGCTHDGFEDPSRLALGESVSKTQAAVNQKYGRRRW